jgi:hypothetical protein
MSVLLGAGCTCERKELARSRPERSGVHFSLDPAATMGRPAAAPSFRASRLLSGIEVRTEIVEIWNYSAAFQEKDRGLG